MFAVSRAGWFKGQVQLKNTTNIIADSYEFEFLCVVSNVYSFKMNF